MADQDPIVLHVPAVPAATSEAERLRQRLDANKARLRDAVEAMEAAAQELTPAARIRHDPLRWVAGAFVVGLVLGLLTGGRR